MAWLKWLIKGGGSDTTPTAVSGSDLGATFQTTRISGKSRGFIPVRSFWSALLAGAALIMAGFFLDDNLDGLSNAWRNVAGTPPVEAQQVRADLIKNGQGNVDTPVDPQSKSQTSNQPNDKAAIEADRAELPPPEQHALTFGSVLVLLLKELGVAFWVAGLIGLIIEKRIREHESELFPVSTNGTDLRL